MRRQGPSEGDVAERKSREYKKGTSERRGSIYTAGAAGPCEDANLTERHTRFGRPPFPDAATACSTLHTLITLTQEEELVWQSLFGHMPSNDDSSS
jgi:hypothetical protein